MDLLHEWQQKKVKFVFERTNVFGLTETENPAVYKEIKQSEKI